MKNKCNTCGYVATVANPVKNKRCCQCELKRLEECSEALKSAMLKEIDANAELKRCLLRIYRISSAEQSALMRLVFGTPERPTSVPTSEWCEANEAARALLEKHDLHGE